MRQLVKGICSSYGISYELSYKTACPVTFNESQQTESATKAAITLLGEENCNGNCEV